MLHIPRQLSCHAKILYRLPQRVWMIMKYNFYRIRIRTENFLMKCSRALMHIDHWLENLMQHYSLSKYIVTRFSPHHLFPLYHIHNCLSIHIIHSPIFLWVTSRKLLQSHCPSSREVTENYGQGSFWVWAQLMRKDVTLQRRLSLAEPIPKMISDEWHRLVPNECLKRRVNSFWYAPELDPTKQNFS